MYCIFLRFIIVCVYLNVLFMPHPMSGFALLMALIAPSKVS